MMRRIVRGFLVLALALPAVGATPAVSNAQSDAQPLLYVANQSSATVSIIDMETDEVVHTIDLQALGYTANAKPHHVAVESDGSYWYLSLIADGWVLKFNRANEVVGRAKFETPGMLALDPNSDLLYVGRSMAAVNPPQRIGVIRRGDMSLDEMDVFFPRPHAIALSPAGDQVYTASLAMNQLAALTPADEDIELVTLDGPTHVLVQFAVAPDGRHMVAGGEMTGRMLVFDISGAPGIELERQIEVNRAPWHPVFSDDGAFLYFGNRDANTVTVVDTETWSVVDVIAGEGLAEPHGTALSPDGRKLYVSNRNVKTGYAPHGETGDVHNGTVVVIDTESREIVKVIEVGQYAAGLGAATPAR